MILFGVIDILEILCNINQSVEKYKQIMDLYIVSVVRFNDTQ